MSDNTLRNTVHESVNDFLQKLDGVSVDNLYKIVLTEVEKPLLTVLMRHVKNNQSKVATMLGLSRGTTRKKLKEYGMLT